MKALLFCLIAAATFNAHAGDTFDVVKNGRTYTCYPQSPAPTPGNPVDCANKAYSGPFNRDESLSLCQGAYDTSPADCGAKAYAGPFNKAEAVTLCRDNGSIARADCAVRAYSGPYTKEQAIQLCMGTNPAMMSAVLKDLIKEKAVGFDAILQRANSKAAVEGVTK